MIFSRVKLKLLLVLPKICNYRLYETVYNDNNYLWKYKKFINDEKWFIDSLISEFSDLPKWYFAVIAKMRAFGSGSDIKIQMILAKKGNHNIVFPLNNLVFSEINRRKIRKHTLIYIIDPKFWMRDILVDMSKSIVNYQSKGYYQFYRTKLFTRVTERNKEIMLKYFGSR